MSACGRANRGRRGQEKEGTAWFEMKGEEKENESQEERIRNWEQTKGKGELKWTAQYPSRKGSMYYTKGDRDR